MASEEERQQDNRPRARQVGPKALPSIAKIVPSVPNIVAMPATYNVARPNDRRRETPRPPKTLIVMGIIG